MKSEKVLNKEEQTLLVEQILSDPKLFVMVSPILKGKYFDFPNNSIVDFITQFYEQYGSLPSFDVLNTKFGVAYCKKEDDNDRQYYADIAESYFRLKACRNVVMDSIDMVTYDVNLESLPAKFEEALSVSLRKDLGTDQFLDVKNRLLSMQKMLATTETGWQNLDAMIGGGISRGQMVLIAASTGVGKSLFLANMVVRMAQKGFNCAFLSLELNEPSIAKRIDSMITGIENRGLFDNIDKVVELMQSAAGGMGNIITKKLPGSSTANDIRNYLKQYELQYGRKLDVLAVDYLDIMHPISMNVFHGAFEKDKAITEELRNVFVDENLFGLTASQLNRDVVGKIVPDISHVAGGLSKINTTDIALAIMNPSEDVDIGERVVYQLKIRDAERHPLPVSMYLDQKTLLLSDGSESVRVMPNTNIFQAEKDKKDKKSLKQKLRDSVKMDK